MKKKKVKLALNAQKVSSLNPDLRHGIKAGGYASAVGNCGDPIIATLTVITCGCPPPPTIGCPPPPTADGCPGPTGIDCPGNTYPSNCFC